MHGVGLLKAYGWVWGFFVGAESASLKDLVEYRRQHV